MPNWACGEMSLVIPTKNVDKFLSYINGDEDKHFYRTSFEESEEPHHNSRGLSKLSFQVECAWSAENCLINPDPEEKDCISLEEVCNELKVQRLAANFKEYGLMFGETIEYDKENGMSYDSFELGNEADVDFDDDEEYIDAEDNDEVVDEVTEPSVSFDELYGIPESD